MKARIVIEVPGLCTTVQDAGRFGHQGLGVPLSGAIDRLALAAANALVGNPRDTAALEISYAGPSFEVRDGSIRIAVVGGDSALKFDDGSVVPANQGVMVQAGQKVAVQAPRDASSAIIAVAGGISVGDVLCSRSTYLRAEFGGFAGRVLLAGDILDVASVDSDVVDLKLSGEIPYGEGPIRVVLGPQSDFFDAANIERFLTAEYEVTTDSDRMGMRLAGPVLDHAKGHDIVTDGVVNGSIQVPGSGLPMILLADRQTVGGYPKIATVISSDLPRLARMMPGQKLRFQAVTIGEAIAARRAQAAKLDALLSSCRVVRRSGVINIERLHAENLISGVVGPDD